MQAHNFIIVTQFSICRFNYSVQESKLWNALLYNLLWVFWVNIWAYIPLCHFGHFFSCIFATFLCNICIKPILSTYFRLWGNNKRKKSWQYEKRKRTLINIISLGCVQKWVPFSISIIYVNFYYSCWARWLWVSGMKSWK